MNKKTIKVDKIHFHDVRCTICNDIFTPVPGGDPICPDCFKDIDQANQHSTDYLNNIPSIQTIKSSVK